ncbi:MAG: hypothetical protein ACP5QK_07885 [Myxococcota bacterium]
MLVNEKVAKAISLMYAAGIFKEKNIRYISGDIKEKIIILKSSFEKAKMMKEITDSFVEMYIWKDRRFLRD